MVPQEIRVAVLCGGKSGEREISLVSGKAVEEALIRAGFNTVLFDTANPDNLVRLIQEDYDVAFIALHGKYGEDGRIQGFLETIDLPYTGSGIWASATGIDKIKTKNMYRLAHIPTPRSIEIDVKHKEEISADDIIAQVGADCVIKAPTEGSTIGVFMCHTKEDIAHALEEVFNYDSHILVEEFVAGREYTVSVLGTGHGAHALPVIQIIPVNEFYDFESKYSVGGSEHLCPAPLTDEQTAEAQHIAEAAHRALCCKGVSRTDLILDADNKFWALETNTIPGMTQTSLLPDAAHVEGIEFPELCTRMIEDALQQ